ncbi:MAG: hypothetical protein LWW85_07690, partial [Marinilabiliales bacterium]|nr:hypothetical protein [Marinilabiliales bacterium]
MANEVTNGRQWKVFIPLTIVIILVAVASWYWYVDYTSYISTDDAHIESDNVQISSKILGRIARIYHAEGDTVKMNSLVAELDSTDLIAQKLQIEALVDQSNAQLEQAKAKLKFDNESLKVYEVSNEKAREDFERAKVQLAGDVITREQFDHMKKAFETTAAQLNSAKSQLTVSRAQIESATSAVNLSV